MAGTNIAALQSILDNAAKNETLVNEIRKAAGRVQKSLDDLNALLSDDYQPKAESKRGKRNSAPKDLGERDPEAPYGRDNDGNPKAKPGRKKASAA